MSINWTNQYAPLIETDYVFHNKSHRNIFKKIEKNEKMFRGLLLYGPPGVGKTSFAKLIANSVAPNSFSEHNCTLNSTKVDAAYIAKEVNLAPVGGDKGRIIILNEFEKMSDHAQKAFNGVIEDCQQWTQFIITTNNIKPITSAIRSRMTLLAFDDMPEKEFQMKLIDILQIEKVTFTAQDILDVTDDAFPDLRKAIGLLEIYTTVDDILELPE